MENAKEVAKEDLNKISFSKVDVLASKDERRILEKKIEKAVALGNNYKGKVRTYFKDSEGVTYFVETTLWSNDANDVTFKGGQHIPLKAIIDIDF
jgi:hypothetical protein